MTADFGDYEVRIFDPFGVPVQDIRVSPTYSFVLNDVGDCTFTISTADSTFREAIIEFGGIVVINHTHLPSWVGFIDPINSRMWNNGSVDVVALSAEKIYSLRFAPTSPMIATPGKIFKRMLENINDYSGKSLKIYPGEIEEGGFNIPFPLYGARSNVLVYYVTRIGGTEYNVTPDYDESGNLFLRGNLYAHKGSDTQITLSHENTELDGAVLVEGAEDDIYNYVLFYSSPNVGAKFIVGAAQKNEESIAKYGTRMYLGEMSAEEEGALNVMARRFLHEHAWPKKTITPSILNVNGVYRYLDTGNYYNWENHLAGFTNSGLGAIDYVRLVGMEVNTMNKKINALMEGWSDKYDQRSFWVNEML